jgi:histidyl-tRNA synthetase
MWDFAHYKHCDVLDKFKQMLRTISAFCMVNGKKEKAIGEYSVKNMKKGKKH